MSITLSVPIVSQLTNITTDKQPSENRLDDCVAACVCMLTMFCLGVKSVGGIYTPDNFKDMADGQGFVGFTAAVQYVAFCAKLGVRLYHQDGDQAQLIALAKANLSARRPVIFTEPDPYSTRPGDSHVCIFYADSGVALGAIDPFIAKTIERPYSEWQAMLQFGQVWTGEKIMEAVVEEVPNSDDVYVWNKAAPLFGKVPLVPAHGIPQSWLRAKHKRHVELGPPLEEEVDTGPDVRQLFLMGRAVYTKGNGTTTWYLSSGPIAF